MKREVDWTAVFFATGLVLIIGTCCAAMVIAAVRG